ncbi:c-type cytochrome [Flagellimonas halotolerans]|uniref:C-type cytochrome n=1 Tax=Flagellimonas halotolerans TaxID=3112164 RepID=A0ABU6IST0_9FLAO|nr:MULTISPECIES: c-type cytochrome [unclassified Allomuricauda]MEC3966195.1 c-type cytochrome [Muricauda sp. SYSU M86414]MEC4266119.1 c-type cytochrome [Muricauda sp. SYSU M84420]
MRTIVLLLFVSIGCTWHNLDCKVVKSQNKSISDALPIFSASTIFTKETQEKSTPKVKLHLFQNDHENLSWGSFIRYAIEVSDKEDGDSKYGEILNNKVLLEIEFLPIQDEKAPNKNLGATHKGPYPEGLSLMMGSTCFACHGDKEVLAGPSFSQIAERYGKNLNNIALLGHRILTGSTGQWGSMEMPAHPDLTAEESEKIAAFILTQGSRKNHRILTGLEGTFQVMEKPDGQTQGVYILTASYTSNSSVKGQDRITLQIQ